MKKLLISATLLTFASVANSAVLFEDDFESYSLNSTSSLLSSSNWNVNAHGIVTTDPIQGDKALSFNGVDGSGDLWSPTMTSSTGIFDITFDYLGTCSTGNCGGFFWNSATGWVGTDARYPDLLVDDGSWNTYNFQISASSLRISIEDWNGSGRQAGDAFFDNIVITDGVVPVPAPLALMGLGLLGLGINQRRKKA